MAYDILECPKCGALGSQAHAPKCKGRKRKVRGERKVTCKAGEMVSGSYEGILAHVGHKIVCVGYGGFPEPENVAIECEDCGEVIVDFNYIDETHRCCH